MAEDPLDPGTEPAGEREDEANAIEVAPVLARLVASAAWRTAGWTAGAYVDGMNWLTRAALSNESTAELLNEVRAGLRDQVRNLIGADAVEERVYGNGARRDESEDGPPVDPLRERGLELLERSADVGADEDAHPAYKRIIEELAPDEARILRLLATKGARPSIDVKTWRPLGIGSQTVAPGLSMIGAEAGCRHPERVSPYLDNLFRLGLIWFSREPLDDPRLYQVLEAQPEVIEAMKRAGRGSTTRRSIHLTSFGVDFCETCLPLSTAEFTALQSARSAEGRSDEHV